MKVTDLVKEIDQNRSQTAASQKDEVRVMQAMLNDTTYKVGVYDKSGKKDEYCPAEDFKKMAASVVSSTTKISKDESEKLLADYEVTKSEAGAMVNISKEFINTYLGTGRKISLGGREKSNFALSKVDKEETTKRFPKKVGVSDDGKDIYEHCEKKVPAHTSIKAHGTCPSWAE